MHDSSQRSISLQVHSNPAPAAPHAVPPEPRPLNSPSAASTEKHRVYFNEYNVLMGNTAYLPLVSGLLKTQAMQSPAIMAHYEFMPFLFIRGPVEPLLDAYDRPAVAAFSLSMWNERLCTKLAAAVKQRYPDCLIVFGGPQVTHHADHYMRQHVFVDVTVRGAGEQPFADLLERLTVSNDFSGIAGLTWRSSDGRIVRNEENTSLPADLDDFPSPYLEGCFDDLFDAQGRPVGDFAYQTIIETC